MKRCRVAGRDEDCDRAPWSAPVCRRKSDGRTGASEEEEVQEGGRSTAGQAGLCVRAPREDRLYSITDWESTANAVVVVVGAARMRSCFDPRVATSRVSTGSACVPEEWTMHASSSVGEAVGSCRCRGEVRETLEVSSPSSSPPSRGRHGHALHRRAPAHQHILHAHAPRSILAVVPRPARRHARLDHVVRRNDGSLLHFARLCLCHAREVSILLL